MGLNNQAAITGRPVDAYTKSNTAKTSSGTKLASLNKDQKNTLTEAGKRASIDPNGVEAQAFKDAGINKSGIDSIAKGQFEDVGNPLPQAKLSSLLKTAEETTPSTVSIGDTTSIGDLNKPPTPEVIDAQVVRSEEKLAGIDSVWGEFGAQATEEKFNVVNGDTPITEQSELKFGDNGIVTIGLNGDTNVDSSQIRELPILIEANSVQAGIVSQELLGVL